MNIEIRLAGSGTKEELVNALEELATTLKNSTDEEISKFTTLEDATLCTSFFVE